LNSKHPFEKEKKEKQVFEKERKKVCKKKDTNSQMILCGVLKELKRKKV
jgi:hypothetical protein